MSIAAMYVYRIRTNSVHIHRKLVQKCRLDLSDVQPDAYRERRQFHVSILNFGWCWWSHFQVKNKILNQEDQSEHWDRRRAVQHQRLSSPRTLSAVSKGSWFLTGCRSRGSRKWMHKNTGAALNHVCLFCSYKWAQRHLRLLLFHTAKVFNCFHLQCNFSYTNHVVVQNISTSRRGGQHERTQGANHEQRLKKKQHKSSGREEEGLVCLPPPFVNETLHLRCKHQCKVDRVRERTEWWIMEGGATAAIITSQTTSSTLAASAWGHGFSQSSVFFCSPDWMWICNS